MLDNLSKQIRECLRHAEDCARKAKTTSNAELRDDYLILERRWLFLARSYELTEGSRGTPVAALHRQAGLAQLELLKELAQLMDEPDSRGVNLKVPERAWLNLVGMPDRMHCFQMALQRAAAAVI